MKTKAKIIIPIVMGVGVAACVAVSYFSSSLNAFDKYEIVTVAATQSVDESTSTDLTEPGGGDKQITDATKTREQAIAYLKNNKVWDKNDMEQYPALKGLWDDLNNFNFEVIKNKWADVFTEIGQKDEFLYDVGQVIKKKLRAKCPATYCTGGDTKINFDRYYNNIIELRVRGKYLQSKKKKKAENKQSTNKNSNLPSRVAHDTVYQSVL